MLKMLLPFETNFECLIKHKDFHLDVADVGFPTSDQLF